MIFEELCAIYFPEKYGDMFSASAVFEYCKEKDAVLLTIEHNAGIVSDEELQSDLSFVIVRRLADELEQKNMFYFHKLSTILFSISLPPITV